MASAIPSLPIFRPSPKTTSISIPVSVLPNLHLISKSRRLLSRHFLCSQSSLFLHSRSSVSIKSLSSVTLSSETKNYEFTDGGTEVELRFHLAAMRVKSSSDIFVDTDSNCMLIRVAESGTLRTIIQTDCLFDRIVPDETIWYIDEDQLVVSLKKHDTELKWPDINESWESLRLVAPQLLKGVSIYVVGESKEINEEVARVLAVGIGYTPLNTCELLEKCFEQPVNSWVDTEGSGSVAEAEALILQSLSSHVRTVVATLGHHGAASRHDKWRHLHAGFTVWLSKSEAEDEASTREEALEEEALAYNNADVVVKLAGRDKSQTQMVAQICLGALKQLILSDKQLPGKKSLYLRLGCRGDWPNIKPPGWDPTSGPHPTSS